MSLTKTSYSMIKGAPLNVLDFGADPTGVADSTTAIQACLNAGGANAAIRFPRGTYLVSATLNGFAGQHLMGDGVNQTVIQRYGNYGDTLRFTNIGSGSVRGMWFVHSSSPAVGFTTLANKATTGAHLHILNGQGVIIEDCWFWRMPYQVQIDQGSIIRINRCSMQGAWNLNATSAAQEGVASIVLGVTNYCVLIDINNCYLGGYDGGAQTVSFVISDNGTQVVNFAATNAGSLYGIQVIGCEGLSVDSCYIGGNATNNIFFAPNNICSQIRITNNYFDSAGYNSPCVYFSPAVNGFYAAGVTINDNVFNGQLYAFQGIGSINTTGSQPAIASFTINANSFINGLGTGIFLNEAQDGVISNNQISSYNSRNLTPGGDTSYGYAIAIVDNTSVLLEGNIIGGNINSGSPGGYTYGGVSLAGTNTNVVQRTTIHNGTGTSANIVGKADQTIVIVDNNYTCTGVEDVILVDGNTGAYQISLPVHPPTGNTITVKDYSGNSNINNITVVGTIDNALNLTINTAFAARTFTYNGLDWNITAGYN